MKNREKERKTGNKEKADTQREKKLLRNTNREREIKSNQEGKGERERERELLINTTRERLRQHFFRLSDKLGSSES